MTDKIVVMNVKTNYALIAHQFKEDYLGWIVVINNGKTIKPKVD